MTNTTIKSKTSTPQTMPIMLARLLELVAQAFWQSSRLVALGDELETHELLEHTNLVGAGQPEPQVGEV
jgi:hypothetical protein